MQYRDNHNPSGQVSHETPVRDPVLRDELRGALDQLVRAIPDRMRGYETDTAAIKLLRHIHRTT